MFLHGRYDNEFDLVRRLKEYNIDVICLLSPWPETYSYILSEAWNCNIPVIVSPLGALNERVSLTKGGIVLSDLKADTFVATVIELSKSPTKYSQHLENVKKINTKSTC